MPVARIGDTRARRAPKVAHARSREGSDLLRGEPRADVDHDVAGAHVAAARPHVLTGFGG